MSWKIDCGAWCAAGIFAFPHLVSQPTINTLCWVVCGADAEPGADAIICLSGGRGTRTPECLRLWNEGYGSRLFVSRAKKQRISSFISLNLVIWNLPEQ